jgi:hypothetical protein
VDNDDVDDDLKARIQELEDELQQLKEKRKQEYTDSAAVDEEIEEVQDQIRDEADQSGMSRRKFMKTIAGGGAALGAAAMMPSAAALDIESNNPLSYNENFSVDTQGDLNLGGNNITNAGSIDAASGGFSDLAIDNDTLLVLSNSGEFFDTYNISSYDDVLDTVSAIQDDLPEYGGTIIFSGWHYASTQLVIDKPLTLMSFSEAFGPNSAEDSATDQIIWQGGTTTPIILRGTNRTPNSGTLENVRLEGFLMRPETPGDGDTALYLDGDTNGAMRDSRINIAVDSWGGTSPVIHGEGTVFGVYFTPRGFSNTGDVLHVEGTGGGPPSEIYVIDPQIHNQDDSWALYISSNTGAIRGGRIQQQEDGAHGAFITDGMQIYQTKFEGWTTNYAGGTAIQAGISSGGMHIAPDHIAQYDTGIKIGDGTDLRVRDITIGHIGYNENNTDIHVTGPDGAVNNRKNIMVLGMRGTQNPTVQNDAPRPAIFFQPHAKNRLTWEVPVDSTGVKTNTIYSGGWNWDRVRTNVIKSTANDYAITDPIIDDATDPSGGHEVAVEVLTASSTSGATATIEFEFELGGNSY